MKSLIAAVVMCMLAAQARAVAIVDVVVSSSSVRVGDYFDIELRGSLSQPVLGWGLDLAMSPQLATPAASPQIGPDWIPVSSADGDGLAGLAFPNAISGSSILLARIEYLALAPGVIDVAAAFTPADLTEGFALDPSGFEGDVRLGSASVTIVPEASPGSLLVLAVALIAAARRLTRPIRAAL